MNNLAASRRGMTLQMEHLFIRPKGRGILPKEIKSPIEHNGANNNDVN